MKAKGFIFMYNNLRRKKKKARTNKNSTTGDVMLQGKNGTAC
jgi:hypothetical protein